MRSDTQFSRRSIRECLSDKRGKSAEQVAAESGFSVTTCRRVLHELHDAKRIHVFEWEQRKNEQGEVQGGLATAMYALGNKRDVPKPPRTPKSVSNARYKVKHAGVLRAKALAREGKTNMFDQLRIAA